MHVSTKGMEFLKTRGMCEDIMRFKTKALTFQEESAESIRLFHESHSQDEENFAVQ